MKIKQNSIFLASLGSAIEYYDFVVYGMLAKYLKSSFFPSDNDAISTLQFFSVFAMGYAVRPLGGMVAGMIGDRWGRRPAFLYLTTMMAISTMIIGFLPDYTKIGFAAPILLVLCRLVQGFSFGGELPGAATIVAEFSPLKKRAYRISFVVASASIGALLASLGLFCLTSFLSEAEITAWGWRIPFIMGGTAGIFLFWLRTNLSETTAFSAEKIDFKIHNPLKQLFRRKPTSILIGIMLTTFASSMVIGNLYFPLYINKYYDFPLKNIYFSTTISLIFSALILPLTGRLADKYSKVLLLKWATLSYAACSTFIFVLLSLKNSYVLTLFMMIHQLFIAVVSSCYYPMIINLFPVNIRYTGFGLSYNLTYAMMGMLPAILTVLLDQFHTPRAMPMTLSVLALVSFFGTFFIKNNEKE